MRSKLNVKSLLTMIFCPWIETFELHDIMYGLRDIFSPEAAWVILPPARAMAMATTTATRLDFERTANIAGGSP